MNRRAWMAGALGGSLALRGAIGREAKAGEVVVYASLDKEFSEPILDAYQKASGVTVKAKYDIESTKTVGLTNQLMAERDRPRCDLFWNNEILNTLRLKKQGLLAPFELPNAADFPAEFRDAADKTWYGFASRARILLVNAKDVPEAARPKSIRDLLAPKWKGKIGIAKPLFGTTATHAACLFSAWGPDEAKKFFGALKANGVQVFSGNRDVARAVGNGTIAFGLTDTDDAMEERAEGSPVAIVYPDREKGGIGTLYIPNTLSIIKGGPNPAEAAKLAAHLLSPAVETALAKGRSMQIPLNPKATPPEGIESPKTVTPMPVDFARAVEFWDAAAKYLAAEFAGR